MRQVAIKVALPSFLPHLFAWDAAGRGTASHPRSLNILLLLCGPALSKMSLALSVGPSDHICIVECR